MTAEGGRTSFFSQGATFRSLHIDMDSIARVAIRSSPTRPSVSSPRLYGIRHWANVLKSIPRAHILHHPQPHKSTRAHYATGAGVTRHEKATGKMRLAPRMTYQPTNASTWIISNGSVSADKEAISLAKGLSLPWQIKRVQWRQGT